MEGKKRWNEEFGFEIFVLFRTAIDSLSKETEELTIATDTRQSTKRRILIVGLWFFSTLVVAVFLPNISIAIHYLGALAASFIFIFPGLKSKIENF